MSPTLLLIKSILLQKPKLTGESVPLFTRVVFDFPDMLLKLAFSKAVQVRRPSLEHRFPRHACPGIARGE